MIWPILAVKALAITAACYNSRAVSKALTLKSRESAPVRMLTRAISARVQSVSTMERMVATKAASLIRGFVQTTAFDQVVLTAVAQIRARAKKGMK